MMEEETSQLIIRHLNGLKTDIINEIRIGIKSEIRAVKRDIENSISDNMSALETKINAGQEELGQEISDFQERIRAGQAEFEERATRNLREDLSRDIKATRQDVKATRRDLGGHTARP
jgi:gas vesicle protein